MCGWSRSPTSSAPGETPTRLVGPPVSAQPLVKRQRMDGAGVQCPVIQAKRQRDWLDPPATAEPKVRCESMDEPAVQCPVNSERHLHLDLVSLLLATDEADHLTKYALGWTQHVSSVC